MVLNRAEWRAHWPTVLAGMIGLSLTSLYTFSTGAFIGPIEHDLGWSRTEITFGLTIATTWAAIVGPFVGAAVDRFGSRVLAIPGVVIFCASLAFLSEASTPWFWWLQWTLVGIASGGIKPTIWVSAVSSLFLKNRGLALAFTLSGAALGSVVVPMLSTQLIAFAGWRMAYVYMALLYGGVAFLLIVLFFHGARDKQRAGDPASPPVVLEGMGWRPSMLSRRYFCIFWASLICAAVQMAYMISLVPIFVGYKYTPIEAAGIAAIAGVTSIISRLVSGVLIDRWDPRILSTISVAIPAATGALLLAGHDSFTAAVPAVVCLGISVGAELEAATYLTARYFGLKHFGLLFGVVLSGITIASGIGPLLASVSYDHSGSYTFFLWATIPLSLFAGCLIAALGKQDDRVVAE